MTKTIMGLGIFAIAFALMGIVVPTYSLVNTAYAADLPCRSSGITMKIDGITEHVDISKYNFQASLPVQQNVGKGGGSSAGQPQFANIVVMKTIDENTPKILQTLARGQNISSVHIQVCYGQGQNLTMFEIWLEDVRICNYDQEGKADMLPPTETIEFCYQ